MKSSQAQTRSKVNTLPDLQFEADTSLTRYAGVVLVMALIQRLDLRARLRRCFAHLDGEGIIPKGVVYLLLIVQLLLGLPQLRDASVLAGDRLVMRLLGLTSVPSFATLSRLRTRADDRCLRHVHALNTDLVATRLQAERLRTVTMDFDGSVQSTARHAQGSAIGFNKVKKGARSYYPLFATIAQTSQIFDLLHRPGNVHDSNGAADFAARCYRRLRRVLPKAVVESRFDSAFFQLGLLQQLDADGVAFTVSVPFQKWPALKAQIEGCTAWQRVNETWSVAEHAWRPKSWPVGWRVLLVRQRRAVARKGPLQLDLFEPRSYEYDYQVIMTNKAQSGGAVLHFHHGRGSQEKLLGEGKQAAALGRVAVRSRTGNELFTLASAIAHNLGRELQMIAHPPTRSTSFKRPAKWVFQSLATLQKRMFHRVGRLVRPQGRLTLKIAAQPHEQKEFMRYMQALKEAA